MPASADPLGVPMRGTARWWLFVFVVAVLTAALGTVGWIGTRESRGAPVTASRPLAVVLLPDVGRSTLVVVDLLAGTVVRRIGLRSTATDIAVDASSGLVVGAQSGGFGPDVDRAASLTDVRAGTVRYVELPSYDPGDVACAAGRAFLLHSTVEASGAVFSVVDVAGARVAATGNVPGPPGLWTSGAGAVWATCEDTFGERSLCRLDPGTFARSTFRLGTVRPMGLAEADGRPLVLGSDGTGTVVAVDPEDGAVEASAPVIGLLQAPRRAVQVGRSLVVGDWSGDEPEGRALRRLDAGTLRDLGPLRVDGVPCALAAWDGRLLVVDRERGRLLVIDPESGRARSVIELGESGLVFSDVVVVGAGEEG